MRRKFKLIVSDLDGTIFDSTYTITDQLRQAVQSARAKGCLFTLATGRSYPSAVQYSRLLDVEIPLITYNGAMIRYPGDGKMVSEVPLAKEKAREIMRLTEGHQLLRFVHVDDMVYTDSSEELIQQYSAALKIKFRYMQNLQKALVKDPTMLVLRSEPQIINSWTFLIRKLFGATLYTANSRPFFLDIVDPRVSKGAALKCLAHYLGISPAETIAIGDEANDLEMMAEAGLGATIGNAAEPVKKAAGYVAAKDYWEGVIEIIERFVL